MLVISLIHYFNFQTVHPHFRPVNVDNFPSNSTNFSRSKDRLSRSSMFIIAHISCTIPTLSRVCGYYNVYFRFIWFSDIMEAAAFGHVGYLWLYLWTIYCESSESG